MISSSTPSGPSGPSDPLPFVNLHDPSVAGGVYSVLLIEEYHGRLQDIIGEEHMFSELKEIDEMPDDFLPVHGIDILLDIPQLTPHGLSFRKHNASGRVIVSHSKYPHLFLAPIFDVAPEIVKNGDDIEIKGISHGKNICLSGLLL